MKNKICFEFWSNEWLEYKKSIVKESTYIKYRSIVFIHINPFFENLFIEELSNSDIQQFLNVKSNVECLSTKTVTEIINVLKSIISLANDFSVSTKCNFKYISLKRKEPKTIRVLSKEEEKRLIEVLLDNMDIYKLGVLIGLYSGIRLGEICALKWENIDFENNIIHIVNTMQRLQTFDESKKTHIVITVPKTKSSYRDVPIPYSLSNYMKKFISNNNFVLSTEAKKFIEPRVMQYRFKKYLKIGKIDNANFHSLRHTFATRCIESGVEAKVLSEILGHSSVTITLDRYVHSSMEYKQSNIKKFDDYMENFSQS